MSDGTRSVCVLTSSTLAASNGKAIVRSMCTIDDITKLH